MKCAHLVRSALTLAVLALGGCPGGAPPNMPPQDVEPPLPWSEQDVGAFQRCVEADRRLRQGFAMEEDYWFAVQCVVVSKKPEDVDAFILDAQRLRGRSKRFIEVTADALKSSVRLTDLPAGRLDQVTEQIKKHRGAVGSVYVDARYLQRSIEPHLGGGSRRTVCANPFSETAGHYELTIQAAKQLKGSGIEISLAGKMVLAQGAQDVDKFEWANPAAHGETPFPGSSPGEIAAAEDAWVAFVRTYVDRAKDACVAGDETSTRRALYFLGFSAHAIEDVASHRGRTSQEHAYNMDEENADPDEYAFDLAETMAAEFLAQVLRTDLRSCAALFAKYTGPLVNGSAEKRAIVGHNETYSPQGYSAYCDSMAEFKSIKDLPGSRVRWFGQVDRPPTQCSADAGCAELLRRATRP